MSERFVKVVVVSHIDNRENCAVHDTQENRFALFSYDTNDDLADVIDHMNKGDLGWSWSTPEQATIVPDV